MRISKIDGAGDLGDEIVQLVQGKSVVQTETPVADAPSAVPSGPTPESQPPNNENDRKVAPPTEAGKGDPKS